MQKFRVRGADRENGSDATVWVEATSKDEAAKLAMRDHNMVVADVVAERAAELSIPPASLPAVPAAVQPDDYGGMVACGTVLRIAAVLQAIVGVIALMIVGDRGSPAMGFVALLAAWASGAVLWGLGEAMLCLREIAMNGRKPRTDP